MAISSERASVDSEGRRASFESGAVRDVGVKGVSGAREEVGSRKDESAVGMDLVRWKVGARWVVRNGEGCVKSF